MGVTVQGTAAVTRRPCCQRQLLLLLVFFCHVIFRVETTSVPRWPGCRTQTSAVQTLRVVSIDGRHVQRDMNIHCT